MGWEFHNRRRDRAGRFESKGKNAEIHFRVTDRQHAAIRERANGLDMEITEYILRLIRTDMLDQYGVDILGRLGQ